MLEEILLVLLKKGDAESALGRHRDPLTAEAAPMLPKVELGVVKRVGEPVGMYSISRSSQ